MANKSIRRGAGRRNVDQRRPQKRGNASGSTSSDSKSGKGVGRFIHRGAEGFKRSEEELAKRGSGANTMRFWLQPGEEREVVILDRKPDCFVYEHHMRNPQTKKFSVIETCPKEYDTCPICELGDPNNQSYYGLFLTVLDLTKFKDRKGKVRKFSRKLLLVKPKQHALFKRMWDRARKQKKDLRGTILEMHRDSDKDPRIGNDIQVAGHMSEEQLKQYVRKYKDNSGKTQVEKAYEPYDYEEVIPEPNMKRLRALAGAGPTPGSENEVEEEFDEEDDDLDGWDDEDADEEEWGEDDDEDDEDDDEDDEELDDEDDTDDEDDDEEDDLPFDPDEEDEDEEGDEGEEDDEEEEPEPPRRPSKRKSKSKPVKAKPARASKRKSRSKR